MHYLRGHVAFLLLAAIAELATADELAAEWVIQGQVVDEQGAPVDDFDAATFWSSNGVLWNESGQTIQANGWEEIGKIWKQEGVLAARPQYLADRSPGGCFRLKIQGRPRATIFYVDKHRRRGGVVLVERDTADQWHTLPLEPLVRVTAQVYCAEAGRTPDFSLVRVYPVNELKSYESFMLCGSLRGKISLLLPPGTYDFAVSSESPNAEIRPLQFAASEQAAAARGLRVDIPRGKAKHDLGVLNVSLPRDKQGIPRDYSQFYGKAPPPLSITDARGVSSQVKLADFRGKWVLLDFWSLWCPTCITHSLPELAQFYEERRADRNRFEILAICNTEQEQLRTMEAYAERAAPLAEQFWQGKNLPFPVLLDGEGETSRLYGIQQWPTLLLIDPEGNLVRHGDLATLREKLEEAQPAH